MGRSGRSDVLWSKRPGPVPARRQLCRQDSARGQAGRHPRRAAEQVRSYHQPYDSQGARPRGAPDAARPRRRGDRVKRRAFITLLGGAAAAWPLAAHGQQADRMRRIGVLMALAADEPDAQMRSRAFLQALPQLGWTVGRNVQIDTRWATTDTDSLRRHAAELAALAPDVLVAGSGTATIAPLLQATRTVPIVFTVAVDPVGAGFGERLGRPGGNATGFTTFEYGLSGKWLELLKEIAPHVTRAAVLRDPTIASGIGQFAAIQAVAPALGIELVAVDARDVNEID